MVGYEPKRYKGSLGSNLGIDTLDPLAKIRVIKAARMGTVLTGFPHSPSRLLLISPRKALKRKNSTINVTDRKRRS